MDEKGETEFWQAGKSVDGINEIESAEDIVTRFKNTLKSLHESVSKEN